MTPPSSSRSRWRAFALVAIVALYILSVPWYRAPDASPPLLFGLPDWVAVAIACYFGAAILNAVAWSLTTVPDAVEDREPPSDRSMQ